MPENLGPYIPAPLGLRSLVYQAFWRHMLALYCRLDAVTAPSRTAAAILHRQGLAKPVYPISCGVDFERFRLQPQVKRAEIRQRYRIDENTTAFLYVGRVDGEKRLDVLMAALKLLDRQDIQLVIAGKGAALEATRQMAQQMGLGRRVVFTGHVPAEDLPALLNSADVFTIASQAELLSIATLEAMACARPVLLARSQALAELVIDGVNGFGFRPGDPADAARWMAALANQPESWPAMGQASLELVRPHRLENTLRLYEDIYEALLAHKPAPQADFLPERIRPLRNFILRAMSQLWQ
jgi:glycosyltransferase involved in cell wall biosynthesis